MAEDMWEQDIVIKEVEFHGSIFKVYINGTYVGSGYTRAEAMKLAGYQHNL
jgi:hypothetical protein